MSRKVSIGIIVVLIVIVATVVYIVTTRDKDQAIRIGAALPLTGDGAEYGNNARKAIALAVEEINADGGINGQRVIVLYEDTRLQPKDAVSAVMKLITVDRVKVLIGPMSSAEVEAVLPICERNDIILVSPSATDHNLSGKSKYFFRTIASDTYEGKVMAEFAFKQKSYKSVAIFYIESAGPFGVCEAFQHEFIKLGGQVPTVEKAQQNSTDLRAQLARIKDRGADALFFAGFAAETATMLIQAKELTLAIPILAHQTAEAPEVRELAGPAAEGVVFASGTIDPQRGSQSVREFYIRFKKRYDIDPQNYAPNAYDALMVVVKAIEAQGSDTVSIRKGLMEIRDYDGATGILTFEPTGDVVLPMKVMVIRDGKIVPYEKDTE